jgi:hypothetical protein
MRRIMLGPHARSNDCGFASPWRCALPGGHGVAVPSVLNRFGIPSGFEAGLQLNIAWNAADGGGPYAARTVLGWKSGPIVLELLACPRLLTEARFARCFAALVSRRGFRPCCSAACGFNVEIRNAFGTLSRTDRESKKTCSQDCAKAVPHGRDPFLSSHWTATRKAPSGFPGPIIFRAGHYPPAAANADVAHAVTGTGPTLALSRRGATTHLAQAVMPHSSP